MASTPDTTRLDPRYKILGILGRGGMGVVYKALDQVEGRLVALKMLDGADVASPPREEQPRPEQESAGIDVRRFAREIGALSLLNHPGIVRFLDVGQSDGRTYYTMEHLDGLPVQALLARPLPGKDEIEWIVRLALRALGALDPPPRAGFAPGALRP
jgi:eukaryotic-like serine/threonine-protein kinase